MKPMTADEMKIVDVYIPCDRIETLPRDVQLTLRHYVGVPVKNIKTGERAYRYRMSARLANELEEMCRDDRHVE